MSKLADSYKKSLPVLIESSKPSPIILAVKETEKALNSLGITPTVAVCLIAISGMGLANLDAIVEKFENDSEIRSQISKAAMETDRMVALEISLNDREKIAVQRYENNPIPVIPVNICAESGKRLVCPNGSPTVAITDGKPVIDPNTLSPLSEGTLVADLMGNTAVILKDGSGFPVVSQVARTGDRQVIDAWWKRQKSIYGESINIPTSPVQTSKVKP